MITVYEENVRELGNTSLPYAARDGRDLDFPIDCFWTPVVEVIGTEIGTEIEMIGKVSGDIDSEEPVCCSRNCSRSSWPSSPPFFNDFTNA